MALLKDISQALQVRLAPHGYKHVEGQVWGATLRLAKCGGLLRSEKEPRKFPSVHRDFGNSNSLEARMGIFRW